MPQWRPINTSRAEKLDLVDHCGRPIRYDSRVAGIQERDPQTALFLVFAVAAGATIVKADKGAKMSAAGHACSGSLGQRDTMPSISFTAITIRKLGLNRRPARQTTWHLRRVIMPRRSITGRLVRGQVWRRHDGRRWLYKKFVA